MPSTALFLYDLRKAIFSEILPLDLQQFINLTWYSELIGINNTSRNQRAIQFLPFLGPHPNIVLGPVFGGHVTPEAIISLTLTQKVVQSMGAGHTQKPQFIRDPRKANDEEKRGPV